MHRDRSEGGWSELKGKAKRQWDKFNDKPLDGLNINRDNLDEDVYGTQKIKKERADKHLENVENMLQNMTVEDSNNVKPFVRK